MRWECVVRTYTFVVVGGVLMLGAVPATAATRSIHVVCKVDQAATTRDVAILNGQSLTVTSSGCSYFTHTGAAAPASGQPSTDNACEMSWCAVTVGMQSIVTGPAILQFRILRDSALSVVVLRVYLFGSKPPPAPRITNFASAPSSIPTPTATPTVAPSSAPTTTPTPSAARLPGQVITAGQTAYTLCERAQPGLLYDIRGYLPGTTYGKINRGEQFTVSVPVPKAPQWLYWRLSKSSQALGSGALGSMRVNGCDAVYTAPANNEYVGGALPGVDIFATYGHDPAPTPTPTSTLPPCPAGTPTPSTPPSGIQPGAPSGFGAAAAATCAPTPEPTRSKQATNSSGAEGSPMDVGGSLAHYVLVIQAPVPNAPTTPAPMPTLGVPREQWGSASGSTPCSPKLSVTVSPTVYGTAYIYVDGRLIAVNYGYISWSSAQHRVYITGGGRVLLDRFYNGGCGLTQIKFT